MRIFTDIASHDTTGVAPGGRIARTDSTPEEGIVTPVNGKFVFTVPEGAALKVDTSSFWFPQEDVNSIPSRTAAEFLIRYPMYDHILYNFYLDNEDVTGIDTGAFATLPDATNTTPVYTDSLFRPPSPRCQLGRGSGGGDVGMVPNSLSLLPRSGGRANNVYGCVLTATVDLWSYNPCYIEVNDPVTLVDGDIINLAGIPLTARAGAPVADEFQINGVSAAITATNLAAAITLVTNSFSGFVTATVDPANPNRVQLRPVPSTNTAVTVASAGGVTGFTVVESHPGTDEVMMWWSLGVDSTTEDQGFTDLGAGAGKNVPAIKSLTTIIPEPSALLVYASVDDGVNWSLVSFLEPVDLVNANTEMRLCFINVGGTKLCLHGFCVLFPDLPSPL